jgi:hypothetical protein
LVSTYLEETLENIHKDTVSIESYDEMAKYYENYVDKKPWNAYYERPATLSLLPVIKNKKNIGYWLRRRLVYKIFIG